MNSMNNEAKSAISLLAQHSVDLAISQSRKEGTDPIAALDGLVAFSEESLHWAREAMAALKAEAGKNNCEGGL